MDGMLLLAGLTVSLALNFLLLALLLRAKQRVRRLRTRRREADAPAARINARAHKAQARQDARPLMGTALLNAPPAGPAAAGTGGVVLAKKPGTRRAPVLPKDIALDYQGRGGAG
ncbi:MAG: hypothetical protein D6782_08465 [Alphaproteobacteria bacterium]|nr:MAG: hypothetical protein D6782_08465 [Alphaproteobacteria bacterium]